MNPLLRLYPEAWRARYGSEFEALLVERPPSTRDLFDIALAAVDAHLSPQVESPARRVRRSDRLAGFAAIAGGVVWSGSYVSALLVRDEINLGLPILFALGLMLLSLPGRYLRPYAGRVLLVAVTVVIVVPIWLSGALAWEWFTLLPIALMVLGALGPGALALAATRARLQARDRWRLLLLTMPWPVATTFLGATGLMETGIGPTLLLLSMLPMGIAWVATGARIADSSREPRSSNAIAGGAA